MKLLFINPRHTKHREVRQKCTPPLALLYLTSALNRAEIDCAIIDDNVRLWNELELQQRIAAHAPDAVGIAYLSEIGYEVARLCKLIRQTLLDVPIVIGGSTASALPDLTLRMFPEATYVLCGEADRSIVAFAKMLQGELTAGDVPGLVWRDGNAIKRNPSDEIIHDLDNYPIVTRHLLAAEYREKMYYNILEPTRPIDVISTTRGCAYDCRFCYNVRRSFRGRSPENIVAEIRERHEAGIRALELADNTFATDRKRAMDTFRLLAAEKLPMHLHIKARATEVDAEFCEAARSAGVVQIAFGYESGSQRILDAMNKRITVAQIEHSTRVCRRAGLQVHSAWIVGYPGETRETLAETLALIERIKPTTVNFEPLYPYPETEVYRQAKQDDTLIGDWSTNEQDVPWIKLPWLNSREELYALVRRLQKKAMLRPRYLLFFAYRIVRDLNINLARYAWQEFWKALGNRRINRPDIAD